MNKTKRISGLLWALLFAWGSANAAGLGKLTVQSTLGQPLKAEIELLSVTKDEIADLTAKLASADAFKQARIDRHEALSSLRFSVDQRANGQPVIRISSTASVQDPFLDMLIELNWSSGRLIREYTILLDPPASAKPAESIRPAVIAGAPTATVQTPAADKAGPKAPPAAPAAPTPKVYGPVKSGETLRGIASKVKPADVSLDQMMIGLYQANKSAFQGNNINRLSRGSVLKVPGADAAHAVSPAEASRTVKGHVAEWHAYRRKLAEMAGETPSARFDEPAAGTITQRDTAQPAPAPSAPKDVLKLSKGEPAGVAKPDARTQERMHAMEEELAAKGRALQEAQDRVSQLERTVRDMQKLLEMKQQEAAKAPPVTPAPPMPEEFELPPPDVAPAPTPTPLEPVEAPKPAPVIAPLPVAEPSSSWISTFISNPIYIGGIVAALLLSVLLWMMMVGSKRRQGLTKFEDSIMTGGEFKNNAVFNASAGNVASGASTEGSMLLTDFSRLGMGAIDSHEVDPIAEAEVYMAYGRDAQAEEILREALIKDPSRYEIALKLLELYATRKDVTSFETTASELYAGLGGQNTPVWQRAAEMGRSIDPQNPLYRVATPGGSAAPAIVVPVAAAAATAAVATVSAAPVEAARNELDFGDLEKLAEMGDWNESARGDTPAVVQHVAAPDLDFASQPAPFSEAEAAPVDHQLMEFETDDSAFEPAAVEPEPISPTASTLDFEPAPEALPPDADVSIPLAETQVADDLSLDFDSAPDFDFASNVEAPAAEEPELPVAPEAIEELSALELPESYAAEEIEATAAEEMPVLDLSDIDLDLDAETTAAESAPELPDFAEPPPSMEFASDFDQFADLSTSADLAPEPEQVAEAASEPELSPEPSDVSEIDPELHEEVTTKLDLARAYLEMGDREGAREILQEVLGEGDTQQRAEAGKLLSEAA
jgi:pilus assembly protein FimV